MIWCKEVPQSRGWAFWKEHEVSPDYEWIPYHFDWVDDDSDELSCWQILEHGFVNVIIPKSGWWSEIDGGWFPKNE